MVDNISELTYPYFTDGTTQLNAQNLNPIIAKINEVIRKVNGGGGEEVLLEYTESDSIFAIADGSVHATAARPSASAPVTAHSHIYDMTELHGKSIRVVGEFVGIIDHGGTYDTFAVHAFQNTNSASSLVNDATALWSSTSRSVDAILTVPNDAKKLVVTVDDTTTINVYEIVTT